ncbi:MAG: hypothetical protein E7158_03810 [Firmicutes bacterium]|jgi:archaellin|nr:hypothetical protein [Bacillota bacterium]
MKKVVLLLVVMILLCGCSKKETSILNNEYMKIDGLYIDESKDDSVMDILYVFYTINSKDKNIDVSSKDLTLVINNTNEYKPLIYDEYSPIYTNYYYNNESKNIYVGKSFKLCTTFKIPKDDLKADKSITFKSDILKVDDLKFTIDKVISKKNLNEISMDLDKDTFDTKYIQGEDLLDNNSINASYIVTFKNLPGITYVDFNSNLGNNGGLGHLLDIVDEVIINDKYPQNTALEDAKMTLEQMRKSYGDTFNDALAMYGFTSVDDYLYSIKISFLRNIEVENYVKSLITDKEISDSKVDGTKEDKINDIYANKLSNDSTLYNKALINLRNEYGMVINDEGLANAYEDYIKQK